MTPVARMFGYQTDLLQTLLSIPAQVQNLFIATLDQQEIGGGNLTLDVVIRDLILAPIAEKLDQLAVRNDGGTEKDKTYTAIDKKTAIKPFSWGDGRWRTTPNDYKLNPALSPLDVWTCWHFGQEMTDSKGMKYLTPPWKALSAANLKMRKDAKQLSAI
jgi:hypothetical protein